MQIGTSQSGAASKKVTKIVVASSIPVILRFFGEVRFDHKLIRVLLPEYFKNVEVREVVNPSEFEEALKEFKPDLVTLDIKMPGMDGITICTKIKSNPEYSHIKVMAVSGQIRAEMKEKMFKAGADTFLVKPIHPRAIQAKILELFESELIEVIPVEESVEHAQVD